MSILIKGMNLPKEEVAVIIYSDGEVRTEGWEKYSAVEVPEHGRLIDADELKKNGCWFPTGTWMEYAVTMSAINNAPTVIPADKDGET